MQKEDIDILFLSEIIPEELKKEIICKSRKTMRDAAIALQWKIINGIEANLKSSVTLYNQLPIYSFPGYYKDCFIKTSEFHHNVDADDINLGFFNLKYVKYLFLDISIKKYIAKWARNGFGKKKSSFRIL